MVQKEEIKLFFQGKRDFIFKFDQMLKFSREELNPTAKKFRIYLFSNFKKIQNECFEKLLEVSIQISKLKEMCKQIRYNSKIHRQKLKELEYLELFEKLIRNLMDSIVWSMMEGQTTYISKFYKKFSKNPLTSSNYEEEWNTITQLNNESEEAFFIYNDLTSVLQIGDTLGFIYVRDHIEMHLFELKFGKVNKRIMNFIEKYNIDLRDNNTDEILKDLFEKKKYEQMKRMLCQKQRMIDTANLINNDYFEYPDGYKYIITSLGKVEYFHKDINECIQKLSINNPIFKTIDDCLHIGVYNRKFKKDIIEIRDDFILHYEETEYIFSNYITTLDKPNTRPVFQFPIDFDSLFKLIFNEVIVFLLLDLGKFVKLANMKGLPIKLKPIKKKDKKKGIKLVDSKVPYLIQDDKEFTFTSTFFFRPTQNMIKPSSLIEGTRISLDSSNLFKESS
jgi:hypothetical protein